MPHKQSLLMGHVISILGNLFRALLMLGDEPFEGGNEALKVHATTFAHHTYRCLRNHNTS